MDYADQLIAEGRNNINHKADYTHKCRCWGKCFDAYKKQTKYMDTKKFLQLFGAKELKEVSIEYPHINREICDSSNCEMGMGCAHKKCCPQRITSGKIVEVYYGPWRDFLVTETGIWTTISCPVCGYSEFWAAGDGDERF